MKKIIGLMVLCACIPSVLFAFCEEGETHENNKGTVFVCDTSNTEMGEAWRTESGIIWGEPIKSNGTFLKMSQFDAEVLCTKMGARLPSSEDYMELIGELRDSYYIRNNNEISMIPDLTISWWFWTSTIATGNPTIGGDVLDRINVGSGHHETVAINGPNGNLPWIVLFYNSKAPNWAYTRCVMDAY